MNRTEIKKHISGYLLGATVFLILMPLAVYLVSLISPASIGGDGPYSKFILYSAAACLATAGGIFVIWSNVDLLIVGRGGPTDFFNKAISPRSKNLVTGGPYQYTRNPMVFGVNALYIAFSIFLNSLGALVFCVLFLSAVILYLKQTEEKRLAKDFGDEYLTYKNRVSMIIPLPPKKDREK